jgi:hypothetical protein
MSKKVRGIALALMALMFASVIGLHQYQANAGPKSGGTQYSYAAVDSNEHVIHRVLLAQGVKTMVNTTPVNGSTVCLEGDPDVYAARLTLVGTIGAGSAPVITVVLQSSDDEGATWTNVGSAFAAINSTTTPTGGLERITFADLESGAANTPVVWGDCFRVRYTFAGTAATTVANVGVTLYAE